jgi:hypothetical protein
MKQDDFYTKVNDRFINIYSTGGHIERSFKKRTGDIIAKDYEKKDPRNRAVQELFNKIYDTYYADR